MVYYFCHCMSLHVRPGEIFILDRCLASFLFRKKLFFWLSACIVLIVVSFWWFPSAELLMDKQNIY